MFALCYAVTLVAALGVTAAADPPLRACTPPASIECALQTAGVRDPAAMTESLTKAELRTVGDVAELDTAEAAELFGELRAASVPLGDRARLRKVARVRSVAGDRQLDRSAPLLGTGSSTGFSAGSSPPSHEAIGDKTAHAPRRQLQSGGGVSVEVAAIAFTGLIGMVGYAVQARSAQKAFEAQASLEREVAEREKLEAKAAKQLERVQLQSAEWVRPLLVENQSLHFGWLNMAKVRRPREHAV